MSITHCVILVKIWLDQPTVNKYGVALNDTIQKLFESLDDGINDVKVSQQKVTKTTRSLVDALNEQSKANDVVFKGATKTSKALTKLTLTLIALGDAQIMASKQWHDLTRQIIRGTNLLGKNADATQKSIRGMQDSAVAYKKLTGATTEESLKLVGAYQSNQKMLFGELDAGADQYLGHLGKVGRMIGANTEDLIQVQDDLSRKGRFSKEFQKSVQNMMLQASSEYNLTARESIEAVGKATENTMWMDTKARERASKMALEAAVIQKKAGVDFGKYATSLTGATGADRLKGLAILSSMGGGKTDINTLNKQLRDYEAGISEDFLTSTLASVKSQFGIGENESFADAFQNADAFEQARIEEVLKKIGVAGDAIKLAEFERRRFDPEEIVKIGKPDLSGKTPDELDKNFNQVETIDEMKRRGEAWIDQWTVKADGFVHDLAEILAPLIGGGSKLGVTRTVVSNLISDILTSKSFIKMFRGAGRLIAKTPKMGKALARWSRTGARGAARAIPALGRLGMRGAARALPALRGMLPMAGRVGSGLLKAGGAPVTAALSLGTAAWKLRDEKARDELRSQRDEIIENSKSFSGFLKNFERYLNPGNVIADVGLALYDWKDGLKDAKESEDRLKKMQDDYAKKYGRNADDDIAKWNNLSKAHQKDWASEEKSWKERGLNNKDIRELRKIRRENLMSDKEWNPEDELKKVLEKSYTIAPLAKITADRPDSTKMVFDKVMQDEIEAQTGIAERQLEASNRMLALLRPEPSGVMLARV